MKARQLEAEWRGEISGSFSCSKHQRFRWIAGHGCLKGPPVRDLSEDVSHDIPGNIREPEVAAGVAIREALVIEAQ